MDSVQQIELNVSVLSEAASRLQDVGEDLHQVSLDMGRVLQQLPFAWKSDSSQRFTVRVEEYICSIQQNADLAERLSSNLRQLVQEVIYLEQMLAAQMQQ